MLNLPRRTKPQLVENLFATLRSKPNPTSPLSLFVYGLLAHQPPFHQSAVTPFTLQGWQRAFHLLDPMNRGTPQAPGLTLGLAPGGQCEGLLYTLGGNIEGQLMQVWQQEMVLPFYIPTWLQQNGTTFLAMLTDPASPALTPSLHVNDITHTLATAHGEAGTNAEYLHNVRSAFASHSIVDPYLELFA